MALDGQLALFSTTRLDTPVSGGLLACSPALDLTATVGDGNTLYVWRPNDQLVSKHTERSKQISAIRWKQDGTFHLPAQAAPSNIIAPSLILECRAVSGCRMERRRRQAGWP